MLSLPLSTFFTSVGGLEKSALSSAGFLQNTRRALGRERRHIELVLFVGFSSDSVKL